MHVLTCTGEEEGQQQQQQQHNHHQGSGAYQQGGSSDGHPPAEHLPPFQQQDDQHLSLPAPAGFEDISYLEAPSEAHPLDKGGVGGGDNTDLETWNWSQKGTRS
jgi:hypothetical protein